MLTREDYQKAIDDCKAQFKMMEQTIKNMAVAREFQEIVLKHAEKEIKKFPPVPVAEKAENAEKPLLGVG